MKQNGRKYFRDETSNNKFKNEYEKLSLPQEGTFKRQISN